MYWQFYRGHRRTWRIHLNLIQQRHLTKVSFFATCTLWEKLPCMTKHVSVRKLFSFFCSFSPFQMQVVRTDFDFQTSFLLSSDALLNLNMNVTYNIVIFPYIFHRLQYIFVAEIKTKLHVPHICLFMQCVIQMPGPL